MKTLKLELIALMLTMFAFDAASQTWSGTEISFSHPSMGGNSDHTAIYRADTNIDVTRLRVNMGDESSSEFQIGYNSYWGAGWFTSFSLDGYGNGYFRGNVGIGTTTADYALTVNGKIKAEEVKVVVDVPADYVFDGRYNLLPLSDLEQYINDQKHLPGIPDAKTISTEGWNVGEMSNKLLEKVEELTLYLIELKKENDRLKDENIQQQKEIDALKNKLN